MTVDVTSVNDSPVGRNNKVTTLEDTAYTFTTAAFASTDRTDAASVAGANALPNVIITRSTGEGRCQSDGWKVAAAQFVSLADISAGKLVFTPAANANGA